MKPLHVTFVVAALLGLGAAIVVPRARALPASDEKGRLLLDQDVSLYAKQRGPLDGAPGAGAIGFRVSNAVQGMALIVGLDQPVLGVFVAVNVPSEFINAPYESLRVEFTLADGSVRSVKPAGGGGMSMLFQSPEDVPMSELRKLALYVDEAAAWAR